MKTILFSAVALVVTASIAQAGPKEDLILKAQQQYAARDYSSGGIASAQAAADSYAALVKQAADKTEKARFLVGQSEATYFVANASSDNNFKIEVHAKGIAIADEAVKLYGITDVKNVPNDLAKALKADKDAELIAKALYQRGANLGQWGSARGAMASLSEWPQLKANMELIVKIGQESIHEYGALRTLGRAFYKLPSIAGGNTQTSETYLRKALDKTKVTGQPFSKNGYNNTFLAETLKYNSKAAEAKAILSAFIQARAEDINPDAIPETKQAQRDARELLTQM